MTDFSRFLAIRQAYGPSFSPDGRRLAFISNITGVPQAWVMAAGGAWPDQLTFGDDRVLYLAYSPAAERLVFARDAGGNENAQLFLVNTDGTGEKRLTHDDGAMHVMGAWAPGGKSIAYAANVRQRGRYDLYIQHVDSGETQMVWQNDQPGFLAPVAFSPDGGRLLVQLAHGTMNQDLYEVTLSTGDIRHLTPHSGDVRYTSPGYSADGRSVYFACDLDRDRRAVMRLDLPALTLNTVAEPAAEVGYVAASPDGAWLAWSENVHGANVLRAQNLRSGAILTAADLPQGALYPAPYYTAPQELCFAPDGQRLAFSYSTPARTVDIWVWDLADGQTRAVTRSSYAGLSPAQMVEPELIHYPTFDGREIPAWYFRPPLSPGQRRRVVVYVHGGPEGQTMALFYPVLQFLLSRGYTVLAPNVRGSSGYGKTYLNLDNVEKRMDSVADLAHAAYWLRQQPDVDPERIAVYGGSYGGFMVLAALTAYPDLWAAGVDFVGIANFVTFLENTGAYRRSLREAEYGSLERDRELLERISPIHSVDRIRVPLFVAHGANDPRVPLGEAEQIVAALRARNVPVELHVYPDEGHGIVKLANKLDVYPKMAGFLDRHLGGS